MQGGKRKAFDNETERFKFAEAAVQKLDKACPGSITDGMIRVDIMQLCTGEMVVNEFESLEANYSSETRKAHEFEFATISFYESFWHTTLLRLLTPYFTEMP